MSHMLKAIHMVGEFSLPMQYDFCTKVTSLQEVRFMRSAHPTLRPGLWVSHIALLQLQICNEQVGVDCQEEPLQHLQQLQPEDGVERAIEHTAGSPSMARWGRTECGGREEGEGESGK